MTDRISILMVLGSTEMGGAQMFILNLLRQIDRARFQIDLAVNSVAEEDGIAEECRTMGCQIYKLPYFKVYNYSVLVKQWRHFLNEHRYDIVHGHASNSASIYLKIAKETGCVTIAHSHSAGYRGGWMERQVKSFFASRVGRVADYWFACSDKAAERLFGKGYRNYERYYDIPNAIHAESYLYARDTALAVRRQYGIGDGELLCGHVGSFTTPKNHSFLLDVFAEVLKLRPDAKLMCCGTGGLMQQVKEKASAMGILDRVIFTGVVKNVDEYLMAMDVFIFPSLFEGFPISVIEAEAAGLPIVMSDVITKEVDMTGLVHRHSLKDTVAAWARTVCTLGPICRSDYNQVIADSKYNMITSIKLISSLYEEMAGKDKL